MPTFLFICLALLILVIPTISEGELKEDKDILSNELINDKATEKDIEINWITVFEIVLGAVLGFISTVTVGLLTKFASIRRILKKMRLELTDNTQIISDHIDSDQRFIINSPMWDYIINSEILFSFNSKRYTRIVRIYAEIQAFNKSEESTIITQEELEQNRNRLLMAIKNNKL